MIVNESSMNNTNSNPDRKDAWQSLLEVLERVHAKQRPSTKDPKEEEEEIMREIKAMRKERAHQQSEE
jgi:hypothetical protein